MTFDAQITFLFAADLGRADHFYGTVLGLPLTLDQGSCRIYRASGAGFIGVCERPDAVSPDGIIVTLVTGEVDRWHERLTEAGVPCERPPSANEEYRVYHAFYRDPDGYLVEIQEFTDPRWDG